MSEQQPYPRDLTSFGPDQLQQSTAPTPRLRPVFPPPENEHMQRKLYELGGELERTRRELDAARSQLAAQAARLAEAERAASVLPRLEQWHHKGRDVSITKDDGMGASGGWEVELSQGTRSVRVAEYTTGRWGGVTLTQLIGEALDLWDSDF